jgi:hypothetical protein
MHFSIRHRRKNQVPRIDGPEIVARQCGDFWTVIYPGPARAVEANPCKFRLLAGNRGLRAAASPNAGSAVIRPCELIVTDEIIPAAALCRLFLCRRRYRNTGIGRGGVSIDGILAIAVCLHFATGHSRRLDSLSANACGLYLVHYNFIVWLQYALLGTALLAMIMVAIVFGGTLVLSWIAVLGVQRIPFGARLIGAPRRAVATS